MLRKAATLTVAVAISALFLWLAFSKIDRGALVQSFKTINWLWAAPFLAVTWLSMYWRALRWRCLLMPTEEISSWKLFAPLMVGFAFNSIFPARAGEVARPIALRKVAGIPFATGLSTVAVERVLDSLTLLGLFAAAPLVIDFDNVVSIPYKSAPVAGADLAFYLKVGLIGAAVVFAALMGGWYLRQKAAVVHEPYMTPARQRTVTLLGAAVLALTTWAGYYLIVTRVDIEGSYFGTDMVITPQKLEEVVSGTSKFVAVLFVGSLGVLFDPIRNFGLRVFMSLPLIPKGIKRKVYDLCNAVAAGFVALKNPSLLWRIVLHSLMVWVLTGGSFWLMSWAVPGVNMSFTYAMAFLVITCVAILIPAAPGYWGLYEVGGLLALILCGAVTNDETGRAQGMSYVIVVHFLQWILVTVIGLYYAGKIHISPGDASRVATEVSGDADTGSMQEGPAPR